MMAQMQWNDGTDAVNDGTDAVNDGTDAVNDGNIIYYLLTIWYFWSN
jgi:X-X-X-Leu-X-X-Gly heptad repeat protein